MPADSQSFERDENGNIVADQRIRGWANHYKNAVIRYMNLWEELFQKALDKSEFEFICVLLRNRGIEDAGWDSFENTIEAIEGMYDANRVLRGNKRLNLSLWAYGQIVEASDHYEIIANMVNVAGGERYKAWNFPRKRITRRGRPDLYREQTPNEKLLHIKSECARLGLPDYSLPFAEVLDKDLRNAIYHSDYSTYEGMVRYKNGRSGFPVEYDEQRTNKLINEALALHEVIKQLWEAYISSFAEPEIIDVSPGFNEGSGRQMKAQVIVREKHGVMALQEHPQHAGGFMFGIFQPGEQEKIRNGIYKLPRSTSERINTVLDQIHQYKARRWGRFIRAFYYGGASPGDNAERIKVARKILGKESDNLTDSKLVRLTIAMDKVASHLERTYR